MRRYLAMFAALGALAGCAEPHPGPVPVAAPPASVPAVSGAADRVAWAATDAADQRAADRAAWYAHVALVAWYAQVAAQATPAAPRPSAEHTAPSAGTVASGTVWDRLAGCESGGNWAYNGPSGFDGGLQFSPSTWSAYAPAGYPAYAWQATRAQQISVAEQVLAGQGWRAWPSCSRQLGLR